MKQTLKTLLAMMAGAIHNRISNKEYTSVRNKVTNMGTINASNTYTNRQIVYYADPKITSLPSNAHVILNDNTELYLESGTGFTHEFSDGIGVITLKKILNQQYNCLI